jgi:uncharacterized protein
MRRPRSSPGIGYVLERIRGIVRPDVEITAPPDAVFERDVSVTVRDGTVLSVNVFRPPGAGPFPTIMCAHPYGKDALPRRGWFGYIPSLQYRILRQARPVRHSAWTTWESPDPAAWIARGYAVVNCDLRGFGRSGGVGELFSDGEAHDYYDLIEWAASQPWSTGRIGLNGVSYLALSQWKVAALKPPHLAAICPWEGFSDVYRDFARPGAVREDGFFPFWISAVRRTGHADVDLRAEQLARPERDAWWAALAAPLEEIEVPALVCASFSDQGLHSRGSFEGFRRIGSRYRWLYTHRGGKWATYYSDEAQAFQKRFFDCFLKGEDNGMRDVAPVRLEVRNDRSTVCEVRAESAWPLERTLWTRLHLHGGGSLAETAASAAAAVPFATNGDGTSFVWNVPEDVELSGPMVLRLNVELTGGGDASLFVGIRKIAAGANVPFEGAYGFGYDPVAKGWLKISHRSLDTEHSQPWRPVYPFERVLSLAPGEIAPLEIEILPSSTHFGAGDSLQLDIRGRWFFPVKIVPIFGPQYYEASPPATAILHCGGEYDSYLLVPVIPART